MHAHEEREWQTRKKRIGGRLQIGLGSLRKLARWAWRDRRFLVISFLREKEEERGRVPT